ncbi:integrase catalytic domain-containing protein [Trichonephila clavipes]|nr:integrase catalytic domain-containing protein [Trichonephila clavipes]
MDEPIKTFELSTVTYGTTSAPLLATRTLKQLTLEEAENFPLGSSVVMSDMYIDDVLTGAESLLEAKELKNQLINIFAKGGPVVAKAKFFLQKLWMLNIDWADLLPDTINREWRQFVESLQIVIDININRCIVVEQPEVIELHGFSDASQSAYGAVVYCKSVTSDGRVLVHLIASKSRIVPTKKTTIPRLELRAAVLLAKLVHRVKFVYNCKSKESKGIGPLDLGELKKAEQLLLRLVQKEEFKVEMNGIQNSSMVPSNSRVKILNPFIDSEGILRIGGRLRNSDINYNQKFPIRLPSKHKLTYLIVEYFHKKFLHSGP